MDSKLGLSDYKAHGHYIYWGKKYDVTFKSLINYMTTFSLKTITNNKSEKL